MAIGTVLRTTQAGRGAMTALALGSLLVATAGPVVAAPTSGEDPSARGHYSRPAPPQAPPALTAPLLPAAPAAPAPAPAAPADTTEEGSLEMGVPVLVPDQLAPNLVRNGSFEDPFSPQTGFVGTFDAIPGWAETTGRGMEIQNRLFSPPENGGAQYAELASDGPSSFFQEVATEPGVTYRLSFVYTAHPSSGPGGSAFDVTFGTSTLRVDPTPTGLTHWRSTVLEVTAAAASTRLIFSAAERLGQDPGIGAFLDLVEVRRVN